MQKVIYTSAAALRQKTMTNTSDILEVRTKARNQQSKDTLHQIPSIQQCKKTLLYKRCRSTTENEGQYL